MAPYAGVGSQSWSRHLSGRSGHGAGCCRLIILAWCVSARYPWPSFVAMPMGIPRCQERVRCCSGTGSPVARACRCSGAGGRVPSAARPRLILPAPGGRRRRSPWAVPASPSGACGACGTAGAGGASWRARHTMRRSTGSIDSGPNDLCRAGNPPASHQPFGPIPARRSSRRSARVGPGDLCCRRRPDCRIPAHAFPQVDRQRCDMTELPDTGRCCLPAARRRPRVRMPTSHSRSLGLGRRRDADKAQGESRASRRP